VVPAFRIPVGGPECRRYATQYSRNGGDLMADRRPGDPHRLGATWDGQGTNFAVYSSAAAYGGAVELCLLDGAAGGGSGGGSGREERIELFVEYDIWHAYVPGVGPGQAYGYRASGPNDPARGLRFDRDVLLLDPYALAFTPIDPARPRALHSLVVDRAFGWGDDRPPLRPWRDTVLYETHVKSISATHPEVPPQQRGTYAGMAHPAVISHLRDLGVTAVELMPVQQFLPEQVLLDRGLTNFWGYSTVGFFAPHAAYSSSGTRGEQIVEFKRLVRALHAAGIEVILDVVFNHTAEGPAEAPALAFRGFANEVYYRHDPADPSRYVDTTGTSNSVAAGQPEVLRLILDSLRYWVNEMHVDGFRFDLAAALARQHGSVDRMSSFFALLYQDPVLCRVKLIAEPWDLGSPDGYQMGRFTAGWNEWNDNYRNTVRDFWRGNGSIGALASRLAGSADLFGADRRGPDASVNFVTAHDGKTLTDLVTYEGKYNEANGEQNRDGTNDDRASNYGVEGPTDDPTISAVRRRQRRNMLATLLLSQGAAMLCGGDEIGRTQRGNNNAYCQDNATTWYDWNLTTAARDLLAFTKRAIGVQMSHPALRRVGFLTGQPGPGGLPDVTWYGPDGRPLDNGGWQRPGARFLAFLLAGDAVDGVEADGSARVDDDILVVLNAGTDGVNWTIPGRQGARYRIILDTGAEDGAGGGGGGAGAGGAGGADLATGAALAVPARTVLVAAAPR
jgi:isoamylase